HEKDRRSTRPQRRRGFVVTDSPQIRVDIVTVVVFRCAASSANVERRVMVMARKAIAAIFALVLASSGAHAQTVSTTAGSINGTVTDSTKAVLPGVTVTLSGPSVMGTPTSVTDQNGAFRLPNLAPGDYKLSFELTGFGTVTRENIHVSLGFTATVNVEMNPGSVAETVTVSGASPV